MPYITRLISHQVFYTFLTNMEGAWFHYYIGDFSKSYLLFSNQYGRRWISYTMYIGNIEMIFYIFQPKSKEKECYFMGNVTTSFLYFTKVEGAKYHVPHE